MPEKRLMNGRRVITVAGRIQHWAVDPTQQCQTELRGIEHTQLSKYDRCVRSLHAPESKPQHICNDTIRDTFFLHTHRRPV